jgi:hypothetical protein
MFRPLQGHHQGGIYKGIQIEQILSKILIHNICILTLHMHISEFAVFVCLSVYLPDDDLVEVETCRGDTSDKLLFITDCAVC